MQRPCHKALAAMLLSVACASTAPGSSDPVAPIVGRNDLVGCIWQETGQVQVDERSATPFMNDRSLRRMLGLSAAARGATVVVDYRSAEVARVVTGSGGAAARQPRGHMRRGSGTGVLISGGSCAAAAGTG